MKHRGGGNKRELGIQLNRHATSDATGVQSEQQMIAHANTKNEIWSWTSIVNNFWLEYECEGLRVVIAKKYLKLSIPIPDNYPKDLALFLHLLLFSIRRGLN